VKIACRARIRRARAGSRWRNEGSRNDFARGSRRPRSHAPAAGKRSAIPGPSYLCFGDAASDPIERRRCLVDLIPSRLTSRCPESWPRVQPARPRRSPRRRNKGATIAPTTAKTDRDEEGQLESLGDCAQLGSPALENALRSRAGDSRDDRDPKRRTALIAGLSARSVACRRLRHRDAGAQSAPCACMRTGNAARSPRSNKAS
jgi:hypothetical protein